VSSLNIREFVYITRLIHLFILFSILFVTYQIDNNSSQLIDLEREKVAISEKKRALIENFERLTKFAKLYVVTGEDFYKKDFYKVSFQLESNDKFKSSLEEEIEAFALMEGLYRDNSGEFSVYGEPDRERAVEMLHSKKYLEKRDRDRSDLESSFLQIENRLNMEIEEREDIISLYTITLEIFVSLITLLFVLSTLFFYKRVLYPIKKLHEYTKRFKDDLNLKEFAPVLYRDEIGSITEEINSMRRVIQQNIKQFKFDDRKIREYLSLIDENIISISTNTYGDINYVSDAFLKVTGYKKKELTGKKVSEILEDPEAPEVYKTLWSTIGDDKVWRGEARSRKKGENFFWSEITIYPLFSLGGEKLGYTYIISDISDRKKLENLIEEGEDRERELQKYVELVDKNLITSSLDLNGEIKSISRAFLEISGYSERDVIGKKLAFFRHPDTPITLFEEIWKDISGNRTWKGEIQNIGKHGTPFWVDIKICPLFNQVGEKRGYTTVLFDISDKKRVEELLITDNLTGLYNWRFFNEILPRSINIAKREKINLYFMMLDIDDFKLYNDSYGYQDGDRVLIEVANTLKETATRGGDYYFRLGGDEFGVIFNSLDREKALKFAEKFQHKIEALEIEHRYSSSEKRYVTASFGIAMITPDDNFDDETLYSKADELLQKSKNSGRNRIEIG
jgi:diguanylate cyclase (GGDEF)-like protein/PAS domain S-box-containing protein